MRYIIIIATLITAPAIAQTSQFYGADGSYRGTMMPSGPNARTFYDGDGNFAGTAMRAGNNVMLYGADGEYRGMATNSGALMGDE
jgi:hypothetical protein